jgi:chemotaxis protein CheC
MNNQQLARWSELVTRGTKYAMAGLSDMLGHEIDVTSLSLRRVPVAEIAGLVGGAQVKTVGINISTSGSAEGRLLLLLDPKIARAFVDILMQQPEGTAQSLDEFEQSALGEMGNIIGSFFLNSIADSTGLDLRPTPPVIAIDMAGAILDAIAADVMLTQDDAFVAETNFQASDRRVSGLFFVIPSQELLEALFGALSVA